MKIAKMEVTLVDKMGSDLSVVNAARVSFNKESVEFSDSDNKLIKYLAKHNHWSPFAHAFVSLRIKAPIFVARQLVKHQVGLSWNEVSRRYIDDAPEFYLPTVWRSRPENAKQGSGDGVVTHIEYELSPVSGEKISLPIEETYSHLVRTALDTYNMMLDSGVAPEQARMILPQNTMTTWIWSGSLMAFARVCKQRLDPHAQLETQEVAKMIADIVEPLFPVSWKELVNNG